ncbi:M24 family metallopeptidase [Natronosalvus halobius]|uniref:M24 family metallopeptidase n=1 Tax=Natronosalvus halobius TaxID=2953746 RepID=UPI0020A119BA|nr:aminopeptidase P family protein [Natronosalvus halobius]USZ72605.1 M24 family metallopeptidase [Natronosalvus halobius]
MEKLERLDATLEANDLKSVWFARPNSFAWLSGGSSVVDREGDVGVGALGYDGEEVTLLADTIEIDRLYEEELPDFEAADVSVTRESFPWYERSLLEAIVDRVEDPAAADVDVHGLERLDPATVRQPLTATDRERYRDLGRETAAAVEAVCRELQDDDTEDEVTAALTVSLAARDIEAPVVLVGGSERAQKYRHYTPKPIEFGDYALVSVTTQRHGLHASCTRAVAFDPPEWLAERHRHAARVETTALAATRDAAAANGTAGDVFAEIQAAYDALGHAREWERHHQGGAAGFAGREWIATPDHEAPAIAPMAYAWNPTVQGAKSEDTVLVSDDGFETLTDAGTGTGTDDDWPTIEVKAVGEYDLELERPAVLGLE